MERHDEVVDRTCACDVEQPPPLGVAHLLVDRLELVVDVVAISAGEGPCPGRPHDASRRAALRLGGEPRHDGDRELEALGGVDRHDPHGVVVVLGQDRVGDATLRRLEPRPRQVAADAVPADIAPRPRLVDHVAHATPHIVGIGTVERDVEHATFVDDLGQQVGGRPPRDPRGDRADVGDGVGDRMVGERLGWRRPDVPSAAARHPLVQLDVAAAVERAAQRRHERQLVGGVVSGAQRQHQVTDLGRRVDDRAVLGPVRDATLAEGRLERRQRCAGREQDGDVAGLAGSKRLRLLVLDGPSRRRGR